MYNIQRLTNRQGHPPTFFVLFLEVKYVTMITTTTARMRKRTTTTAAAAAALSPFWWVEPPALRLAVIVAAFWLLLISSFRIPGSGAAATTTALLSPSIITKEEEEEEPPPTLAAVVVDGTGGGVPPNYWACQNDAPSRSLPFCNASLSIDDRLDDLVDRLTLAEKVHMLSPDASLGDACCTHTGNISRLGIPSYMWLVEANTGVQAACITMTTSSSSSSSTSTNTTESISQLSQQHYCATQFSGPLSIAASFNRTSWTLKGRVLGTEQRAFANLHGHKLRDMRNGIGLHAYGPNINQQRDARFGRSSELPGEDPYLSGQYARHMVRGLQQKDDNRQHPLVLAYLKHFTAYNRETERGRDNYNISLYDLFDTYLPQFEMALRPGHDNDDENDNDDTGAAATGVMCSYNGINGSPSCANDWLLNQVLRKRWHRPDAHVTTDCSAISGMIQEPPVYAPDGKTAAAWAIMNGTDLEMGSTIWAKGYLVQAVHAGLATEHAVNAAFRRSYRPHFVLGRFDNPMTQPWTRLGLADIHSPYHEQIRLEAALQGLVLLKHNHSNPVLPLNQQPGLKIAVLGPLGQTREGLVSDYANDQNCVSGGYDCIPTLAESIRAVNIHGTTTNASGVPVNGPANETSGIQEAINLAIEADIVVLCLGNTREQEHEGMDRNDTALPGLQRHFAKLVLATQTPVILVLVNGGQVALDTDMDDDDDGGDDSLMLLINKPVAIIEAFNPNDIGGQALAMSLFGLENRWGKLSYTIYPYHVMQGFDMKDHSMTAPPGRTYRYYTGREAVFPFGFGLSLTTFSIHDCQLNQTMLMMESSSSSSIMDLQHQLQQRQRQPPSQFEISCTVENTGHFHGDEVIQVYHRAGASIRDRVQHPVPLKRLVEFRRVRISAGTQKRVSFTMDAFQALSLVNEMGDKILYPGNHTLLVTNGVLPQPIELHVEIRKQPADTMQRG
jgi:xylan 1,4-beta-xylosidase